MGSEDQEQMLSFEHVIIDDHGPENPHIKVVGDIDGDGFVDVVIPSSKGGPLVWYRYPDWSKHVIAPSGSWSCDAKLVDMDGDGDLDILIPDWYGHNRMEWYENPLPDGDPATDPWKLHIIGAPRAHDVEVVDLDGDGKFEIVTRQQGKAGDQILVWKQQTEGTWFWRIIDCPVGEGLTVGDVNGDGRAEIVISDRWYEPPQDIMNEAWLEHRFAEWPPDCVVKLADMNGNGRLDIVLTRSEGKHRVSWFEAPAEPGAGLWIEHVVDDSVDYAHSLIVCDMNGDGALDIVTAEMHQSERGRVLVYLNQGDALHWKRQVVATTGSHKLCVADVGNTGRPDLIGVNWSGAYQPVEMWKQKG